MMKYKILILFLMSALPLTSIAQPVVLNGYAKTKGRESKGIIIPGKSLPGVMIQIKGQNPVLTNSEGRFTIPMYHIQEGDAFSILRVQKRGYELVDKELLKKQIIFSSMVPLVVVLDSITTLQADRLQIERNIRRALQHQLQKKEDEAGRLLSQGKLTTDEYRKRLEELNNQQEKNEKLLTYLSEQFLQLDYDQISEYDRIIIDYVTAGELEKADSLLSAKGSLAKRIKESVTYNEQINQLQEANERLRNEMLALADDISNIADRLKLTMQYDSVAYYLGVRSNLDTTNVRWNLDAGNFIVDYTLNPRTEKQAFSFFQRALSGISANTDSIEQASVYYSIGNYYCEQGNYRQALDSYKKALEYYSIEDVGYARSVEKIAIVYNSMKRYEESERFHLLAIETYSELQGVETNELAQCYNNIGTVYENIGDLLRCEKYYYKALDAWKNIYGVDNANSNVAICYNNLGGLCDKKGEYNSAINFYLKSIDTYIQLGRNPEKDLNIACVYNNLGSTYYNNSDYINAITSFGKALKIMRMTRDVSHPDVRAVQENIAITIDEMSK